MTKAIIFVVVNLAIYNDNRKRNSMFDYKSLNHRQTLRKGFRYPIYEAVALNKTQPRDI